MTKSFAYKVHFTRQGVDGDIHKDIFGQISVNLFPDASHTPIEFLFTPSSNYDTRSIGRLMGTAEFTATPEDCLLLLTQAEFSDQEISFSDLNGNFFHSTRDALLSSESINRFDALLKRLRENVAYITARASTNRPLFHVTHDQNGEWESSDTYFKK